MDQRLVSEMELPVDCFVDVGREAGSWSGNTWMRALLPAALLFALAGCATPPALPPQADQAEAAPAEFAHRNQENRPESQVYNEEKRQETEQISKLFELLINCAKRNAIEMSSSTESAEVVAWAAVALCQEDASYVEAVRSSRAMDSPSKAESFAQSQRAKVVEMALALIVRERQRR